MNEAKDGTPGRYRKVNLETDQDQMETGRGVDTGRESDSLDAKDKRA